MKGSSEVFRAFYGPQVVSKHQEHYFLRKLYRCLLSKK